MSHLSEQDRRQLTIIQGHLNAQIQFTKATMEKLEKVQGKIKFIMQDLPINGFTEKPMAQKDIDEIKKVILEQYAELYVEEKID